MIEIEENVSLYMFASGRHTPELGIVVMWLFFVLFAGSEWIFRQLALPISDKSKSF
jgi:hypothetical protein